MTDALIEQLKAKHGRIAVFDDDELGPIVFRRPRKDELRKFVQSLPEGDGDQGQRLDAADALCLACAVHPPSDEAASYLDELPALSLSAARLLEQLSSANGEPTDEHAERVAEQRAAHRRVVDFFDDECGSIVFRRPKRAEYRRFIAQSREDAFAAAHALAMDCAVFPDGAKAREAFERLPGLPLVAAKALREAASARGAAEGKVL